MGENKDHTSPAAAQLSFFSDKKNYIERRRKWTVFWTGERNYNNIIRHSQCKEVLKEGGYYCNDNWDYINGIKIYNPYGNKKIVEDRLTYVESLVIPIFQKLDKNINLINRNDISLLDLGEDFNVVATYLIFQLYRTNSMREKIKEILNSGFIVDFLNKNGIKDVKTRLLMKDIFNPDNAKKLHLDLLNDDEVFLKRIPLLLFNTRWTFFINMTNSPFITGNIGVIKTEKWLYYPISNGMGLVIDFDINQGYENTVVYVYQEVTNSDMIDSFNELIAQHSTVIVGGNDNQYLHKYSPLLRK